MTCSSGVAGGEASWSGSAGWLDSGRDHGAEPPILDTVGQLDASPADRLIEKIRMVDGQPGSRQLS